MASVITLPVFIDVPNWTEKVDIDGVPYTLGFRWNPRLGFWHASLWDELGVTPIRLGQKVIPILGDSETEDLLQQLAEDDVSRATPAGTTARRLCLFPGKLPGLLMPFSGVPLRHQVADLVQLQLVYFDAAAVAQALAGAL